MTGWHWAWIGWFAVFGVLEVAALATGNATLSNTWQTVARLGPLWWKITMFTATGAVLTWLLWHWLFAAFDPKGLDWTETASLAVGALLGLLAALATIAVSRRRGS